MTIASFLAGVGGLATIVGGIVYVFKYSAWALKKSQAQKALEIDQSNASALQKAEQDGRPH